MNEAIATLETVNAVETAPNAEKTLLPLPKGPYRHPETRAFLSREKYVALMSERGVFYEVPEKTEKSAKKTEEVVIAETKEDESNEVVIAETTQETKEDRKKRQAKMWQWEVIVEYMLTQDGRKHVNIAQIEQELDGQILKGRMPVYMSEMQRKLGVKLDKLKDGRKVIAIKFENREAVKHYLKEKFGKKA